MRQLLVSPLVEDLVDNAAARVASNVGTVAVHDGVAVAEWRPAPSEKRAKAIVTITHPAGRGLEAKYGTLSGAARRAGLEVSRNKAKKK